MAFLGFQFSFSVFPCFSSENAPIWAKHSAIWSATRWRSFHMLGCAWDAFIQKIWQKHFFKTLYLCEGTYLLRFKENVGRCVRCHCEEPRGELPGTLRAVCGGRGSDDCDEKMKRSRFFFFLTRNCNFVVCAFWSKVRKMPFWPPFDAANLFF